MNTITITPTESVNVMGKTSKWLVVSNGKNTVYISVGDKTYNGIKNLLEEEINETGLEQLEITLEEKVKIENQQEPNKKQEVADAIKMDHKNGKGR